MSRQGLAEIKVWDPLVRTSHWIVAIAFFVAYLTEDDVPTVHVWAGYTVGTLVLLRILWGFVGPRHARFSDFVYAPHTALSYLRDLVLARAPRYIGHSPAGGAMVIVLLLSLAGTVVTGLMTYGQKDGAGPLAVLYAQDRTIAPQADGQRALEEGEEAGEERRERREKPAVAEVHEVLANVTLVLVIFHVIGVVLASFVHHENLARAMITGRKRAEPGGQHQHDLA